MTKMVLPLREEAGQAALDIERQLTLNLDFYHTKVLIPLTFEEQAATQAAGDILKTIASRGLSLATLPELEHLLMFKHNHPGNKEQYQSVKTFVANHEKELLTAAERAKEAVEHLGFDDPESATRFRERLLHTRSNRDHSHDQGI